MVKVALLPSPMAAGPIPGLCSELFQCVTFPLNCSKVLTDHWQLEHVVISFPFPLRHQKRICRQLETSDLVSPLYLLVYFFQSPPLFLPRHDGCYFFATVYWGMLLCATFALAAKDAWLPLGPKPTVFLFSH